MTGTGFSPTWPVATDATAVEEASESSSASLSTPLPLTTQELIRAVAISAMQRYGHPLYNQL